MNIRSFPGAVAGWFRGVFAKREPPLTASQEALLRRTCEGFVDRNRLSSAELADMLELERRGFVARVRAGAYPRLVR